MANGCLYWVAGNVFTEKVLKMEMRFKKLLQVVIAKIKNWQRV